MVTGIGFIWAVLFPKTKRRASIVASPESPDKRETLQSRLRGSGLNARTPGTPPGSVGSAVRIGPESHPRRNRRLAAHARREYHRAAHAPEPRPCKTAGRSRGKAPPIWRWRLFFCPGTNATACPPCTRFAARWMMWRMTNPCRWKNAGNDLPPGARMSAARATADRPQFPVNRELQPVHPAAPFALRIV